ncbi:MAG: hypothetical protein KF721_04800 [Ignavibacteriaceae bacterium]|nr:hypothetical protein [Ignavibacteriaceae bacterium]
MLDTERIEEYKTSHVRGSAVIYYAGSTYADESSGSSIVRQNRNMRIGVFVQVRTEHGLTYKDGIVDNIINSCAGLKFTAITKADRVKPVSDEYMSPESQEKYAYYEHLIIFLVPAQFQQNQNIN